MVTSVFMEKRIRMKKISQSDHLLLQYFAAILNKGKSNCNYLELKHA